VKKGSGVIEGSMPHKQTNELLGRTREEKKAGETVNECWLTGIIEPLSL
jgi:hypothetical protein